MPPTLCRPLLESQSVILSAFAVLAVDEGDSCVQILIVFEFPEVTPQNQNTPSICTKTLPTKLEMHKTIVNYSVGEIRVCLVEVPRSYCPQTMIIRNRNHRVWLPLAPLWGGQNVILYASSVLAE